jgi:hypothetical protein
LACRFLITDNSFCKEKEEVIIIMKKLLVILVLLSLVGISTAAFAQTCQIPYLCKPLNLLRVDCTGGDQGDACYPFDFETGGQGACGQKNYTNRAIFAVCCCPDTATNFRQGVKIGLRLSILVDKNDGKGPVPGQNGAYWAVGNNIATAYNVLFGRYATLDLACADPTIDSALVDSFGPGHFYKSTNVTPSAAIATYTGTDCDVPTNSEATVYITERTAGYEITQADEINALVYWRVDIPPMRIEPVKLHNGECIYVRVEFLKQGITGICFDCPPICEAIIKVACVCCEDIDNTSSCFFPYFTSVKAADGIDRFYWNGIAISNTSAIAGTATLAAFEADGKGKGTVTSEEIPPGGMWVRALEALDFGSKIGGDPIYIQVTTTFPGMDGFGMMANSDTGESMGYLCRKPGTR